MSMQYWSSSTILVIPRTWPSMRRNRFSWPPVAVLTPVIAAPFQNRATVARPSCRDIPGGGADLCVLGEVGRLHMGAWVRGKGLGAVLRAEVVHVTFVLDAGCLGRVDAHAAHRVGHRDFL